MKGHPREGEPTDFKQKIIDTFSHNKPAKKIHTIRGNYPYWKKRIDEVNEDEAVLSLRNWTGKPYRSKQHEFMSLEKAGYQRFQMTTKGHIIIGGVSSFKLQEVAGNDGLLTNDFMDWFEPHKSPFEGIIIHFTEFRYK